MARPVSIKSGAPSPHRSVTMPETAPEPNEGGVDLNQLRDELTCSICLEICIRPCSTPCGHSFCRRCLRDALRYSPKCPKCREVFAPGFALNVNSVLWNTIRMVFPKTNEAPASPPVSSPIRRATDRRHLRQILTAEAEVLRRMELDRSRSTRHYVQSSLASRLHETEANGSRRRRRLSSALQESHGNEPVPTMTTRDSTVSSSLHRAQSAAGSVGVSRPRSPVGSGVHQVSRRGSNHHGLAESPQPPVIVNHHSALLSSSSFNTSTSSNNRQTTNDTRNHREDNAMQEMLSSSEYPWIQTLHGQRRAASRLHNGHGLGIVNSLNRSASHGDLQNDVEYVTIQPVQRADQAPSHRRRGVSRFETYNRERLLQQVRRRNRDQLIERLERAPIGAGTHELVEDPEFDEDDFETASNIVSDRDSSFTSSTAAHLVGSRVNSFRFHEEGSRSPTSTAAATQNPGSESAVASFAGFERLYDISSQIEAAMNDIERLSLQPGWARRSEPAQPPATPQTHRSCFELSDDEEEEEVDWGTRIRDAVFIVDDLETDSESEEEEALPVSPFNHAEEALHHMSESQWLSSVEDTYSYY